MESAEVDALSRSATHLSLPLPAALLALASHDDYSTQRRLMQLSRMSGLMRCRGAPLIRLLPGTHALAAFGIVGSGILVIFRLRR
jgi:hypothetical protein